MSDRLKIQIKDKGQIVGIHKRPKEMGLAELEKTLVMMIHGFPGHKSGHSDLYADLEFILNDKGFHTLRFDFIGCGESYGEQEDFTFFEARENFNIVKQWAQDHGYNKFVFLAEGLGVPLIMSALELNVSCMIMLWPGLDPNYLAKTLFDADDLTQQDQERGYIEKDHNKISLELIKELQDFNIGSYFNELVMPILVLHGSADDRFPVDHLNILKSKATSKRIEITTFHDGEHGLPLLEHRKSMFYHITQFLEKFA